MKLETERLELAALQPQQLKSWIDNLANLERELNVIYQAEPLDGFFLDIVKKQLQITETDPENYQWHSFWLLVRKRDRFVVGSADFKDVPDDKGEVEIGYGLGKSFEHCGYMTEAVKAMCDWALKQDRVLNIIAETDLDGFASQRILERCGFHKYRQEETIWWRLKK